MNDRYPTHDRFLLQRVQFHFGLLQSQRCSLHRRIPSRVTHARFSVCSFIRNLVFIPGKEKRVYLVRTLVLLPRVLHPGTLRNTILLSRYYRYILTEPVNI